MLKIKEKLFSLLLGVLVIAVMFYLAQELPQYTISGKVMKEEQGTEEVGKEQEERVCIVLDAGHGGFDPGKVGVNGLEEAKVNLVIAQKVKGYLEANDVKVIMTRETDEGLYEEGSDNKKVQDMKKRIEIMEASEPLATVSIHQNSYTEEYVNGAQVFYYADSKEGETLAGCLQEALWEHLKPENKRQVKSNDSYYLLKKTQIPTVIVECGFLSNQREAQLLGSEEYQDKVAWAIHMGIMRYINKK